MALDRPGVAGPRRPATDNGRAWLIAHQNPNGSWGATNSTRDTAVVLSALDRLGVSGSAPNGGVAHLAGLATPDHDTLSRQIVALAGFDVSALVTTLLAGQNDALLNTALPNFPERGLGQRGRLRHQCARHPARARRALCRGAEQR